MEEGELRALETIFAQVEDPRIERTKQHRLRDIIIIAICGMICGADGWVGIEEFGKAKEEWLTELLKLPNGIPSHDTFGRVFALIDPKQFEASFLHWVQGISTTIKRAGQSHLIFGTASTGSVTTILLSKFCCAIAL